MARVIVEKSETVDAKAVGRALALVLSDRWLELGREGQAAPAPEQSANEAPASAKDPRVAA